MGYFTALVRVTKDDSKWIPLRYELVWVKQRHPGGQEWVYEEVSLMPHNGGGIPVPRSMQVGDSFIYRVKLLLTSTQDYWGEWDSHCRILSQRCIKKSFSKGK